MIIPVETFDMVIFGATGDLAMRKILPALYRRDVDQQIPSTARLIGLSLDDYDRSAFQQRVKTALQEHLPAEQLTSTGVEHFLARLDYQRLDVTDSQGWQTLKTKLDLFPERIRVYYLSVAPGLFSTIAHGLAQAGLNGSHARLVVEKPLGHDLKSAKRLNAELSAVFDEHALYRIDHYLGKETVQNLMALRFANAMFEPLWNCHAIDHVQITAAETLGVGTRGSYYDKAGAIRDMVQNHLLQLLCLIAMEPPYRFEADAVRDEKLKVLHSLRRLEGKEALQHTVRGQYAATTAAPDYASDVGNPRSSTESFVAIKAEIENWRWAGVPFYLRTGKKLRARMTEITIVFKEPVHSVFGNTATPLAPNTLVIRLQPDEGLRLSIMTKEPGPGGFRLRPIALDMTFEEELGKDWHIPEAYERLLMDVVRGNQTLFMRGDEVEAAWRWIDPIIQAWQASGASPEAYDVGSDGPVGAVEMMARDRRRWREIKI